MIEIILILTQTHNYICFADKTGEVVVDELNSITREGIDKTFSDLGVGIAITGIRSNQTGAAHNPATYDHGLNGVFELSIVTLDLDMVLLVVQQ